MATKKKTTEKEPSINEYITHLLQEVATLKNEITLLKQHQHGNDGKVVVPL